MRSGKLAQRRTGASDTIQLIPSATRILVLAKTSERSQKIGFEACAKAICFAPGNVLVCGVGNGCIHFFDTLNPLGGDCVHLSALEHESGTATFEFDTERAQADPRGPSFEEFRRDNTGAAVIDTSKLHLVSI